MDDKFIKSKEIDIDDEIDFSKEAFKKRFRRIEGDELTELKARIASARRSTKSRLTIYLDADIVIHFKEIAEREGAGYQTLINEKLRSLINGEKKSWKSRLSRTTCSRIRNFCKN